MWPVAWIQSPFPNIGLDAAGLDAAGLVSLADLSTIAKRTVLAGNAAYLDSLVICPGLHRQQSSPDLNSGEYPACGALTSGYVFRVENPATVAFLQKVGRTGSLTTLRVQRWDDQATRWQKALSAFFIYQNAGSVVVDARSATEHMGHPATGKSGWHGEPEPGVKGDLLVLLSQDRWVRLQGPVDDLKAISSGQWLNEQTFFQSSLSAVATIIVYLNAALASNVRDSGKLILFILLIASVGLLAIANEWTDKLVMHGCTVEMEGKRELLGRRLKLVEKLLQEDDRNDDSMRAVFAQMGMTVPKRAAVNASRQKKAN